jgi:hypothetical protein
MSTVIKFKTDEGLTPFELSMVEIENGYYTGILERETRMNYYITLPVIGTIAVAKSECYNVFLMDSVGLSTANN